MAWTCPESRTAGEKAVQLREAEIKGIEQALQLKNPDARVALDRTGDYQSPLCICIALPRNHDG